MSNELSEAAGRPPEAAAFSTADVTYDVTIAPSAGTWTTAGVQRVLQLAGWSRGIVPAGGQLNIGLFAHDSVNPSFVSVRLTAEISTLIREIPLRLMDAGRPVQHLAGTTREVPVHCDKALTFHGVIHGPAVSIVINCQACRAS